LRRHSSAMDWKSNDVVAQKACL